MRYFFGISSLFILMALAGCKKEQSAGTAPVIKYLEVNALTIAEFKDSLIIRFEYSDADGDLGENDPDVNSLMIKDRRLSEADYYFVKPLAPPGSGIQIRGILNVRIKNTFLLGTGSEEITHFDLKLRDRAGNWSNVISTPEITITRQ